MNYGTDYAQKLGISLQFNENALALIFSLGQSGMNWTKNIAEKIDNPSLKPTGLFESSYAYIVMAGGLLSNATNNVEKFNDLADARKMFYAHRKELLSTNLDLEGRNDFVSYFQRQDKGGIELLEAMLVGTYASFIPEGLSYYPTMYTDYINLPIANHY